MILVLSVMRVWVSVVHPVAILSPMFCVICGMLMFVFDASGDHMVETYSSMGVVMALYVASIVPFCFPHDALEVPDVEFSRPCGFVVIGYGIV